VNRGARSNASDLDFWRIYRAIGQSKTPGGLDLLQMAFFPCNMFNCSRSLALNSIRSVSIPPPTRNDVPPSSTGTNRFLCYFAHRTFSFCGDTPFEIRRHPHVLWSTIPPRYELRAVPAQVGANMKNATILAALALCALLPTTNAQAQMARVPTPKGIFNPVVGSGAEYEIDKKDGTKSTLQIAIVGKESAEGKDAYWFEISADDPRGGTIVAKDLIVVDGNSSHVAKLVMLMPGRGPIEIPMGMAEHTPMAQPPPEDIRTHADDLGSESVTVPAGTFTCEHYRGKDNDGTDVWVSKDVPPYGLVKMADKNKDQTVLLIKTDKNVQDKITGTPTQFNPSMMMGRTPQ
jgi:hypothetical protein